MTIASIGNRVWQARSFHSHPTPPHLHNAQRSFQEVGGEYIYILFTRSEARVTKPYERPIEKVGVTHTGFENLYIHKKRLCASCLAASLISCLMIFNLLLSVYMVWEVVKSASEGVRAREKRRKRSRCVAKVTKRSAMITDLNKPNVLVGLLVTVVLLNDECT